MRHLPLLTGLVVLALLALSVLWGAGGLDGVFAEAEEEREVALTPADLVAVDGQSVAVETSPSGLTEAEPGSRDQRVSAGRAKAAPEQADPEAVPDVAGVVVDHLGRPVPGVRVTLQQDQAVEAAPRVDDIGLIIEISQGGAWQHTEVAQVTDELGHFLFAGHPITTPGTFTWGREFAWGPALRTEFEAGVTWHELRLPSPYELTSTVRLHVLSKADRSPLVLEGSSLSLVRLPSGVRAPKQGIEPVTQRRGEIEWRLGVGTWSAVVTALDGERKAVTIEVPEAGESYEHEVLLQVWPDAYAQAIQGRPPEGEAPTFDIGRGLDHYIGDRNTMTYDARSWDAHFLQTLRFGTGPVKSASLTLRLKSISGMSYNDGLYLEYDPASERTFRWSRAIKDLPGVGEWRSGERATVHLDLANLPTKEGTISLLPDLEDGMLDVIIQDDTAVLDIDLRIVR